MAKEKKELELYVAEYEEYEATLPGKKPGISAGESSKDKTRAALSAFMKILKKNGRSWPNESDYAEYLEGKPSSKATQQNLSRVRSFFAWLESRRENDTPMKENEVYVQQELFTENEAGITAPSEEPETLGAIEPETAQASEEAEAEITAPNEPESLPEPKKARKNRKNGEKKVPVSVYLDGETYRVINTLSGLTHRTIGDIAASTLSEFAKKNAAKIDAKAAEVQQALEAVKKAMANFTLEY